LDALPTTNETELIARAQRGDRNAFGELVRRNSTAVIQVVYRMCGDANQAEDAAQEAFLRAWQHLNSYRPHASFRTWVCRIAINAALDALRRNHQRVEQSVEEISGEARLADPQPGPEELYSTHQRAAVVQQAILSLSPASRAVLVLREYEGLSYQEIAAALDIPIGTVMSRLNQARGSLRARLEDHLRELEVEHV
jgi:RNA polymerase sigma-70 factor (ECF subfamily)